MPKAIITGCFVLFTAFNLNKILSAQTSDQPATSKVLETIDQLLEQNNKIEQQNAALIEEIRALRQTLAAQGEGTQIERAGAPSPDGAAVPNRRLN